MTTTKKAIIYTRVSDPGQVSGLSLDVQREKCSKWAKDHGFQVVGIYEDGGKTGTKTVGRDGLEDVIIHCQREKIDVVLVIDTDRIARNEFDHFSIRNELKKQGTLLIAINQPLIDGSAEGLLMDGMLASINAFYSRLTGRKVRKSLEKKWEDGIYPSWAPLGYINVNKGTEEKPHRVIEIDPKTGPLIKMLFKMYATGSHSYLSLSRIMFKKGLTARNGKVLSDSSLQQILSCTFYYGWMKWGGMEKWGIHKPLINKTLFDQCQFTAAKHRQFLVRQRKHDFLLRGVVLCSKHDSRFTAEWHYYHHDHYKKQKIGYYHCHFQGGCSGSYIEVNELEKRVANLFKNYQFDQEFIDLVRQKVRDYLNDGRKTLESQRQAIINRRKVVEDKRNNLEDLLVAGTVERETYQRQHIKLHGGIEVLDNELAELEHQRSIDVTLIDEILALSRDIYKTYSTAPTFLKRHYLRFFFEAVYVDEKRITKVVETPLFATLRRQHHIIIRTNWLPREDSNLQP
ncbi:recombinase family protein [Candidatus Daviesbacteria bacterium]|nr:recombinase family protein [Candidatus Daviesbacteria bacterium]